MKSQRQELSERQSQFEANQAQVDDLTAKRDTALAERTALEKETKDLQSGREKDTKARLDKISATSKQEQKKTRTQLQKEYNKLLQEAVQLKAQIANHNKSLKQTEADAKRLRAGIETQTKNNQIGRRNNTELEQEVRQWTKAHGSAD